MTTKYKQPQQPNYWKLHLDCLHSPIMNATEIKNALVDERHDGIELQQSIVCPQCSRHEPGSCEKYNIVHRIMGVTPMFSRQVQQEQQQPSSSSS
jgi:hypothetical protein